MLLSGSQVESIKNKEEYFLCLGKYNMEYLYTYSKMTSFRQFENIIVL